MLFKVFYSKKEMKSAETAESLSSGISSLNSTCDTTAVPQKSQIKVRKSNRVSD